ncbi:MAG: HAD family hydrolase [Oscillospiraceae bacterium]|nr:HAD family hydrolase [Oscillospiraceae bacterium]
MSQKTILWDFDGTVALHLGWGTTMMTVIDEMVQNHDISIHDIRPRMRSGYYDPVIYPWHEPEKAHPELSSPAVWWQYMDMNLKMVFEDLGFNSDMSCKLAQRTHELYIDAKRYKVFPNTIETLRRLKDGGWRHAILSNHIPELPDIADKLGFSDVITECFTSALTGYEKPNITAFKYALEYIDYPEICFMVGDSITADVKGAINAGIEPILIHTEPAPSDEIKNYCKTIDDIENILRKYDV